METLKNLNKLCRISAFLPSTITTTTYSDNSESEQEEEETFFELELLMSRKNENESMNTNASRRVVPVEPEHSPISILKSAPKYKVSLFRNHADLKLKSKPKVDIKTRISTLISQNDSSSPISKLQRQSITKTEELHPDSSKRFSKDVMQNYLKLKLIKPFHLKVAKRCASVNTSNKSRLFDIRECSVSSSPAQQLRSSSSGFRVVSKQLGKSRSASSMVGSRRDESLVVEHDDGGIQSAILHCKKSFNSSTS